MEFLLIIIPLFFIIYEDFKYRAIHWIWLVIFTGLIIGFCPLKLNFIFANLILISFQLLGLTIYFSLKSRKLINITNRFLGIGDILFFLPLCLIFTPENLIWFFISSLIFTLLAFLFQQFFFSPKKNTIPLAAWMSIALIIVFALSSYFDFDLNHDSLVLR